MKKNHNISVGGQAVIEGVMMKSQDKVSMSVRLKDHSIDNECWEVNNSKKYYSKIIILRGFFNFISMMSLGYKCLMKSAEKSEAFEEEAEKDIEKNKEYKKQSKLEKILGDNLFKILMTASTVLSFVFSIGLFMWFPSFLVKLFGTWINISDCLKSLIEGIIKVSIFVIYILLTSFMKEMKTIYMYHGAEHKSIACFEAGKELTVENVKKYSRFHPRCGTSFILISLVISILVFSIVSWESLLIRVLLKLILTPVIVGISYEIIKFTAKHDNKLTRIFILPGLLLQRITTREPDDRQIEVAIDALKHAV